jgi:hypothetical protein
MGLVGQDEDMLEGTLILVVTVILVIVVAAGVVAVLALSRRSADDWKGVIKREREEITQDVRTHSLPKRASSSSDGPVVPRTASLDALLSTADSSSAYFDADRLPGVDRLENVTGRVSGRFDRNGKENKRGGGSRGKAQGQ